MDVFEIIKLVSKNQEESRTNFFDLFSKLEKAEHDNL